MVGGYGSGKTYFGALRAIWLSYVNRPHPGMYVSPTYPMAKKTIILTLKEILDRAEIAYTYLKVEHQFIIHEWNGNIWIGSGEIPDSLKGPNLAWAGIDEPFIQDKEVFKQMNARVRHKFAAMREIFMTGTPEELNWGYDVIANHSGKYDLAFVVANTADNFNNPSDYVGILRAAYSEEEQKAFIDGQFLNLTTGRVYKDFDRSMIQARPDLKLRELPVCVGMDFNVDAMSAEIFYRGTNWVHVFDEIRLKNSNTFDMADTLKKKYPKATIYPDPSGSARKTSSTMSDHVILREAGFNVVSKRAHPPVKQRIHAFNKLMRGGNFSVENAPELVSDLERCTWRSGDIDKRDPERTHASDGAGYAFDYLFPVLSKSRSYKA